MSICSTSRERKSMCFVNLKSLLRPAAILTLIDCFSFTHFNYDFMSMKYWSFSLSNNPQPVERCLLLPFFFRGCGLAGMTHMFHYCVDEWDWVSLREVISDSTRGGCSICKECVNMGKCLLCLHRWRKVISMCWIFLIFACFLTFFKFLVF